jgi:Alginate export
MKAYPHHTGWPTLLLAGLITPLIAAADTPKSAGLINDELRLINPQEFSEWDIGGQFRLRYEVKDGAGSFPSRDFIKSGQDNENDYFLFREKLHLGWQPEKWLKLYVEGRGSQVSSDDRDPSPDQDTWDLQQAYVELGNSKLFPLSLKLGRQELTYGDQRYIGISDWSNTGRSFDAAKLRYSFSENTWIDVFTGRVVIPYDDHLNRSNDYDQFSGVYASTQELLKGAETQLFFLARNVDEKSPNATDTGVGGPTQRDVYTYGLRIKSLPDAYDGWDYAFESAGQFGDIKGTTSESQKLKAYAINTGIGYTFSDVSSKPRLGIGYDYASGDSNSKDGTQETFEPLFGTNHSFYGLADLIGLRNLSSPHISLSAKPTKNLTLSTEYLLFWLANTHDSFYPESGSARKGNGYGKNPDYSSYVGSEIDFLAKYAITPWSELQVGYAHFFASDYIEQSVDSAPANNGTRDADWFYTSVTINF